MSGLTTLPISAVEAAGGWTVFGEGERSDGHGGAEA